MKIKSYRILFRFFSYLSDKTNGAPLFVKYKLLLGTVILGITTSSANAMSKMKMSNDTIPAKPDHGEITCYKPAIPAGAQTNKTDRIEVRGTVIDESGETIIGVSVSVKGKPAIGTMTDIEGNFKLTVSPKDILVFSFLGMEPKEIPVMDLKEEPIILKEDSSAVMCYVVVVSDYAKKGANENISSVESINKLPEVTVTTSPIIRTPVIACYAVMVIEDNTSSPSLTKTDLKNTIPEKSTVNQSIIGIIKDRNDDPLIGVSVVVKKTTNGTITDINGKFILNNVKPKDILQISYIGFQPLKISASTIKENVPIILEEDNQILCYEVVVVGHNHYRDDIYSHAPKKISKLSYTEVDTPPVSPVGNLTDFQNWMNENIRYDERMLNDKIEGDVILSFAIDKKGKIVNKKVIGKLSPEADKEALRILSSSGEWTPGMHSGKNIKTTLTATVSFKMPK